MADFDREMVRLALEERARSGEGGGYELPGQTAYEAVLPDLVRQQAQAEDQQRLLESYQVQPAPVHEAAPLAVPRNAAISPLLNLQDPGLTRAPAPAPLPVQAQQPQVQTEQPPHQRRPVARSSARRDMEAAQKRMVGSFDTRAQHVDEALAAREELGERQQAAYREMGTEAMLARERMDMIAEAHQESVNRAQQEQRELASQIGSYEPTDRRTTGQRVAGAIAMAMSGLADAVAVGGGNAPTGYLNRAMEMIDRSIERDLQQQREMIANKQTQLAAKNTELGQMMARYGDSLTAEKAAYAMRLEPYLREIDALQARGVTDEARQVGSALKDEYRFKQDAMMQEIAAAKYQQEMAARGPTIEQEIKRRKQMADLEFRELEVAGKRQELAGGGGAGEQDIPGYVRTKKVAPTVVTEATKTAQGVAALNSGLKQLAELEARNQGKPWSTADQRLGEDIISQYADAASQLAGGGQAGEVAKRDALERIPNPADWNLPWRPDPQKVYQGLIERNRRTADAKLRAAGYEPDPQRAAESRGKSGAAR